MQIKINDLSFIGDLSTSKFHKPSAFSWFRGAEITSKDNNVVFFTDLCLGMVDYECYKDTQNIAFLIEPEVINPSTYKWILEGGYKKFKWVLSHHERFLAKIPNGRYFRNSMSWIDKEDIKIWPKSKMVSIIASGKNYAPGHQLRHKVIQEIKRLKLPVDIFGYGYNPVDKKIDALKDYKFSIAIENCREASYETEKVHDIVATGGVPIYWGNPKIYDLYSQHGLIACGSVEEILIQTRKICEFGNNMYEFISTQGSALNDNLEIVKNNLVAEDYIYDNYLKEILNVR